MKLETYLLAFLITVVFHLWIIADLILGNYGIRDYLELYSWKNSRWVSVFFWIYASFGLLNLYMFLHKINII